MWMSFADDDRPGDAGPPPAASDAEPTVADEVHDTLLGLLPWGVSILLHVGVFLLAIFVAWSTFTEPEDEEVVVPNLTYSEAPQPVRVQQPVEREIQVRSLQPTQVQTNEPQLEPEPIGVGELAELEPPPEAEPFDELAAEDRRFEVRFFVRGNARKIAFLIDASGSLISELPFVINHLRDAVAGLSEPQEFTVLFFKGDDVIEVPPRGLKTASSRNKQAVLDWLDDNDVTAGFGTNPVAAIRRALQYRPQLLFLLSDNLTNAGAGPHEVPQERLIREIERANLGNTRIKAIQFFYQDPLDAMPGREGTMKRIAREFGARDTGNLNEWYTFIDGRDLNIE